MSRQASLLWGLLLPEPHPALVKTDRMCPLKVTFLRCTQLLATGAFSNIPPVTPALPTVSARRWEGLRRAQFPGFWVPLFLTRPPTATDAVFSSTSVRVGSSCAPIRGLRWLLKLMCSMETIMESAADSERARKRLRTSHAVGSISLALLRSVRHADASLGCSATSAGRER